MGFLPATMELPLYIMFSAGLGRESKEGMGHCDLVNKRKKPEQSWQAHNIKTFYRFLHAAIFWWEGHFQWVVIATVRRSWLAGRWRVWEPLLMEGNREKLHFDRHRISTLYSLCLLRPESLAFSLSLCVTIWNNRAEAFKHVNTHSVGQNNNLSCRSHIRMLTCLIHHMFILFHQSTLWIK